MPYNSEAMYHVFADYHFVIEILVHILPQQSSYENQLHLEAMPFRSALSTTFPQKSQTLLLEP